MNNEIEVGQLIYVRHDLDDTWIEKKFAHWEEGRPKEDDPLGVRAFAICQDDLKCK